MKKNLVFIIILLLGSITFAQEGNEEEIDGGGTNIQQKPDFAKSKRPLTKKSKSKPPITDYKIIDLKNDTTFVDTTLTIQRDYNFNYLRRDDFGLQPINNVGQTYNSLVKVEERDHLLPLFGARARHFNFMEVEDIKYYNVPTPLTELYFKTTFEQGQQLDAFLTINTSPRLNLSIAYKGNRSLGKYQHALTSTGNFRATANYNTKNDRYKIKTHFVSQDLLNEENGGLSENGLNQYLSNTAEFQDADEFSERASIEVNFENAESILLGKRFYLNHSYSVIKKTDSSNTDIAIGHILDITDKSFQFDQDAANDLFGVSYETTGALLDKVALEDFTNQLFVNIDNVWLGNLRLNAGYSDYNYGYNTIVSLEDGTNITNRIKGDVLTVGGSYQKNYKGFELAANGMSIVSGDFDGNYLNASAGYQLNDYGLQLGISTNSTAPNYNFLLYQSDYVGYNWQNFNNANDDDNFKNIETQKIQANVQVKKFANIEASFTTIDNYTYFTKGTDSLTVPEQYDGKVELLKLKLSQNLNFGWLGIDNSILYQNVAGGEVYRIPNVVTRNSIYYQDHWFKRALFLQTGVTFKYYSEYDADGYDPVLSEFYVQSQNEIDYFDQFDNSDPDNTIDTRQTFGGFPQFDIFFNAKIRQTRIYFKVENFGEAFSQNNEFSAPGYAPRDAVIRFGLVWNFFL
ncbi:Putative porin [Aquimarina amphilecti]|uniref:Putative porin n=1 Tax=Aquimarina amphilecti TaxID=1038014 RepID=A0A1H7SKV0_AQUAM|nr:putative porin [Aquimarina amphilecti]SEL73242.1 Putative porin [Aquimarina amphilecti]